MTDLIDRQTAIDDIKAIYEYHDTVTEDRIIDHLKRLPSVDAVEVVRCKDCKHNSLKRVSGNAFCDLGIGLSQIYGFCSYGERKDGNI